MLWTRGEADQRAQNKQSGFTIIELMIATTVFSMVLMIASMAIIQIGRVYYKGLITSRTQETTRDIMDSVSRDLQFSNTNGLEKYANPDNPNPPYTDARAYCVGSKKYTYHLGQQVKSGVPGLIVSESSPGSCEPNDAGQELLGANMRLLRFNIVENADRTYNISMAVAYGDNDLLTIYDNQGGGSPDESATAGALCKSGVAGSNFCATSLLDTTVKRRIH